MVRVRGRAVNLAVVQECGGESRETGVPADEEETIQKSDPPSPAARAAGSPAKDSQATKVRHMAVSDTACITLLYKHLMLDYGKISTLRGSRLASILSVHNWVQIMLRNCLMDQLTMTNN